MWMPRYFGSSKRCMHEVTDGVRPRPAISVKLSFSKRYHDQGRSTCPFPASDLTRTRNSFAKLLFLPPDVGISHLELQLGMEGLHI